MGQWKEDVYMSYRFWAEIAKDEGRMRKEKFKWTECLMIMIIIIIIITVVFFVCM